MMRKTYHECERHHAKGLLVWIALKQKRRKPQSVISAHTGFLFELMWTVISHHISTTLTRCSTTWCPTAINWRHLNHDLKRISPHFSFLFRYLITEVKKIINTLPLGWQKVTGAKAIIQGMRVQISNTYENFTMVIHRWSPTLEKKTKRY